MPIILRKKVLVQDRYKKFLTVVAAFNEFTLSDRELDILNELFWAYEGKVTAESRKGIADKLDITIYNLNNQLGKLVRKGVIKDDTIIPNLIPDLEAASREFNMAIQMQS